MSTMPNDMLRLIFTSGTHVDVCIGANPTCGISWPPPERLEFMGAWFKRTRMSALTDEQAAGCKHLARGAEYEQETPELEPINVLPL